MDATGWLKVILVGGGFMKPSYLNLFPDQDLIFWKCHKSSLLCHGSSHKVKFALANGKIAYSYLLIWSLFIQQSCNPLLIKYLPKYVWAAVWLCAHAARIHRLRSSEVSHSHWCLSPNHPSAPHTHTDWHVHVIPLTDLYLNIQDAVTMSLPKCILLNTCMYSQFSTYI